MICVSGAASFVIAAATFTLSWVHSVERTRWQETWALTDAGFVAVSARIEGSGAGMDPPADARFADGVWIFRPAIPAQRRLVLAASGATGSGWQLCAEGRCREIGVASGRPIVIEACVEATPRTPDPSDRHRDHQARP